MNKLLKCILLLSGLLGVMPAHAGCSFVQSITPVRNTGTPNTVPITGVTAGDMLLIYLGDSGGATFNSISDDNGSPAAAIPFNTAIVGVGLYYEPSAASGTHNITFAFSGSTNNYIFIEEWHCTATPSLDTASSVATGSTVTIASNSITTTQNGDFVVFVVTQEYGDTLSGYTSGFTQQDFANTGPTSALATAAQSAAGAISASVTSNNAASWSAGIAAFKVGAGGSPSKSQGFFM